MKIYVVWQKSITTAISFPSQAFATWELANEYADIQNEKQTPWEWTVVPQQVVCSWDELESLLERQSEEDDACQG